MAAKTPIADLHVDLLDFLGMNPGKTPFDPECKCSLSQMKDGGVTTQVLPILYVDDRYIDTAVRQAKIFNGLKKDHPQYVPNLIAAVENASAFCTDNEPFEKFYKTFDQVIEQTGPLFYISLTWNKENRFGGGCEFDVGLKDDGKRLIEHIGGTGTAIDLSHASDRLAGDIFNFIDTEGLGVPAIFSHTACRALFDHPRNAPDDILKEIIRRNGLIGLYFLRVFLGNGGFSDLGRHLDHVLKLGGANSVCFGSDFFYQYSLSPEYFKDGEYTFFHKGYDNSSCYGNVIRSLSEGLKPDSVLLNKIAFQNVSRFITTRNL